jgi:hypothetical protein
LGKECFTVRFYGNTSGNHKQKLTLTWEGGKRQKTRRRKGKKEKPNHRGVPKHREFLSLTGIPRLMTLHTYNTFQLPPRPKLEALASQLRHLSDMMLPLALASSGWFDRFKRRSNLYDIKVQGEAAAADTVAAESFPRNLAKITEDSGYSKDQIFNVDETGLFLKKMPSRTFIAKEEKSTP